MMTHPHDNDFPIPTHNASMLCVGHLCECARFPRTLIYLSICWLHAVRGHSTQTCTHHYLRVRLTLCSVIICGKVLKGSSKIYFPSDIRLCASPQLSWGFWAFYVHVGTRVVTISFRCWMWDKINSCHLYGIDGEICGLNFLGWLWRSPWQPGNVSIKDNSVVPHLFLCCYRVCVLACAQCIVLVWCVCMRSSPRYSSTGRHTDQTNLSRETRDGTSTCKPDPLFAGKAKQAALTNHSDVIWENLISLCGGEGGGNVAQPDWGIPTTCSQDSTCDIEEGHCQLQYFIFFILSSLWNEALTWRIEDSNVEMRCTAWDLAEIRGKVHLDWQKITCSPRSVKTFTESRHVLCREINYNHCEFLFFFVHRFPHGNKLISHNDVYCYEESLALNWI